MRQTQSVYVRIETQSWKLRWDHVYPVFLIWVCCSVQLTYNRSCITAANTVGVIFSTVNLKTLEDRMIPIALFLQFKALTINMKHTRGSPHPHLLVPTHTRAETVSFDASKLDHVLYGCTVRLNRTFLMSRASFYSLFHGF